MRSRSHRLYDAEHLGSAAGFGVDRNPSRPCFVRNEDTASPERDDTRCRALWAALGLCGSVRRAGWEPVERVSQNRALARSTRRLLTQGGHVPDRSAAAERCGTFDQTTAS